jgi:hypothetical protein
VRYFYSTIGAAVLLVAFNNCGEGFMTMQVNSVDSLSLSGKTCEDQLLKTYESTYHSFLSRTCNNCHINGPGIGAFASPNVRVSYNSFISVGATKITNQAMNANHKPPYTGTQNTSLMTSYTASWAQANTDYATCIAEGGTPGDGGGEIPTTGVVLKSISKAVPANLATTFVRIEWDLEAQDSNKLPLILGIEIRKAVLNNVTQGYEFRNPTLRMKTADGNSYYVRALNMYINGQLQTDVTTYSNIENTITTTTNVNLAPGFANGWAALTPAATDMIAMEFSNAKKVTGTTTPPPTTPTDPTTPPTDPTTPTTPTAVTYTQLVASGGVFAQSCIGCHGANGAGGLNLTSYTAAKNAAANIKARMNNANNPMPTGGLLGQAQRDKVDAWIAAGTPQ